MGLLQKNSWIKVLWCCFCSIVFFGYICPINSYSQTIEHGASGGLSPRPLEKADDGNDCPVGYMYECGPDPMGTHTYTCSCVPQAVRRSNKNGSTITSINSCTPTQTCAVWDRQSFACMLVGSVITPPWCKPRCLQYQESGCSSSDHRLNPNDGDDFNAGVTGSGM